MTLNFGLCAMLPGQGSVDQRVMFAAVSSILQTIYEAEQVPCNFRKLGFLEIPKSSSQLRIMMNRKEIQYYKINFRFTR